MSLTPNQKSNLHLISIICGKNIYIWQKHLYVVKISICGKNTYIWRKQRTLVKISRVSTVLNIWLPFKDINSGTERRRGCQPGQARKKERRRATAAGAEANPRQEIISLRLRVVYEADIGAPLRPEPIKCLLQTSCLSVAHFYFTQEIRHICYTPDLLCNSILYQIHINIHNNLYL